MWAVLLLTTVVLLQVLTLVIFGHPMGREFFHNILDRVLFFVVLKLCKFGIRCHRWGNRLMDHPSLGYYRGDHGPEQWWTPRALTIAVVIATAIPVTIRHHLHHLAVAPLP